MQTTASRASGTQTRVTLTPFDAEGDQFVIGREPAEDEEDRGEQSPGNGEDEGERQDVGDEGEEKLQRHIVIHEEREEFAKDVADHEDEAQDRDREEHVNDQLAADEAVDQFHGNVSWRRSIPLRLRACQWFTRSESSRSDHGSAEKTASMRRRKMQRLGH